jgi:hypothetical protein
MGSENPKGCDLREIKMLNDCESGNTWGVKGNTGGLKALKRLRN